jgi:hypothetical protein
VLPDHDEEVTCPLLESVSGELVGDRSRRRKRRARDLILYEDGLLYYLYYLV